MTYTEVLELIRAGFTKDEISAMMKAEPKPDDATKIEHPAKPDEKPEPHEQPVKQENEKPAEESEAVKLAKALGLKLDSMLTAIQSNNIGNAEQRENVMTADDVIASIINPKG